MSETAATDLQLLARYTRDRAEGAFAELVRRHVNLVHSAALRHVRSPLSECTDFSLTLTLSRWEREQQLAVLSFTRPSDKSRRRLSDEAVEDTPSPSGRGTG